MNLTVQEILKQIKAEEAKDEDTILEELKEKNAHSCETLPKLKRLIVKIHVSPQYHLEKLLDKQHKEYYSIPEIQIVITKGYEKLKTYILNQCMKLKYYQQQQWKQEYIDAALNVVRNVYNGYC
ncbi:hypothetical protein RCL_jg16249.t1 [Rhizophagus clarus]|uniref:Uncharacterized protein n=1 Tax=Rhizophagus clarus TaxID=94130 RepID=A0A8H3M5K8_9GLOM|nr:hypothetical protein RCL_jg16249.t1 [Rhizophagus clarus]